MCWDQQRRAHYQSLSLKSLVGIALQGAGILDEDFSWDASFEISLRGSEEVIKLLQKLSTSKNWRKRTLAMYAVGQLACWKDRSHTRNWVRYGIEDSKKMLVNGLRDSHKEVIAAALCGLGHTPVPEVLSEIIACANHSDVYCRRQAAFALCHYESHDQTYVDALLKLADDESGETRDWATCALKMCANRNDPAINERFWLNAHDKDEWVMCEALEGLALCKDPRFPELVMQHLKEKAYHYYRLQEAIDVFEDLDFSHQVDAYINEQDSF